MYCIYDNLVSRSKRHLLCFIGCSRFTVSFAVGDEFDVTVAGTGTVGVESPSFSEAPGETALNAEVEVVVVNVVEDMEGRVVVKVAVVLVEVIVVLGVVDSLTKDKSTNITKKVDSLDIFFNMPPLMCRVKNLIELP